MYLIDSPMKQLVSRINVPLVYIEHLAVEFYGTVLCDDIKVTLKTCSAISLSARDKLLLCLQVTTSSIFTLLTYFLPNLGASARRIGA